jgi:hypothetical protein
MKRDIYVRSDIGTFICITKVAKTTEEANKYCEENPGDGVLTEEDGVIFIAKNNDRGRYLKALDI